MGKMKKASAAVVVATILMLILLYFVMDFVTRTPRSESPPQAAVETQVGDEELAVAADVTADADSSADPAVPRSPVDEPGDVLAIAATNVLRVILEGVTEEDARKTTVTLTGVDKNAEWPGEIKDSWPWQGSTGRGLPNAGLTSEFDLDPFFATVAERDGNLRDELEVAVDYPLHFIKRTRVPLSSGVELNDGRTVYEVRVRLVPPEYWPELTLAVRDAHTLAHLENVELRCRTTAWMGIPHLPGPGMAHTLIGGGLSSPIVLLGGREADEPEGLVAGLALRPASGEAPDPAELYSAGRVQPGRGIVVYARAPGYAWGTIVLDVSTGAERELLLGPAASLGVRLTNVQLERYAALETQANIYVVQTRPDGGKRNTWFQRLDETLETEGLRIEALEPGEYALSVELGASLEWRKRTVLAREELYGELALAAGETRELVLAVPDPPAPKKRATLGGVVSFPAFGGEEGVRLQLYEADYKHGSADYELSLADMERVGGALPTWSFHLEDLPVGLYQVQLLPFVKNWMIELPADGREDVELVIPELAEVLVETVDARTGERIPLEAIRYGYREHLPGRVHREASTLARPAVSFEGEPGRFHFWTAPGAAYVQTYGIPSGLDYGIRRKDLELVPGLQSVRFELEPAYAIRFEFRDGGAALPHEDGVFSGLSQCIRAVDHEGSVSAVKYWLFEASAPGLYEISFEGIGADRFLPIPARRVEVCAGETTEVIVDLLRK